METHRNKNIYFYLKNFNWRICQTSVYISDKVKFTFIFTNIVELELANMMSVSQLIILHHFSFLLMWI